ncbi:MAG: hypothetical protein FJ100_19720 [Deltaproteobacteria bacterium]|nr:hypothetical protein [Deltaproteobacteria bacterium]
MPLRLTAFTALLLMCGCATPGFDRAPGAPTFKALLYKAPVQAADSMESLEQPALVLGTLKATSSKEDKDEVVNEFKTQARKYGCDAVVGTAAERQEKKSLKTVEVLGPGGTRVQQQQEVVTVTWAWQAQCVRTAAMGDTAQHVAKPEGAVAPTPSPQPKPPSSAGAAPKVDAADAPASWALADALLKRPTLLKGWKEKLEVPVVEPVDAVDALAELMVQVTGSTGLWRKTMPEAWLGCRGASPSKQCRKLADLDGEFRKTDALRDEMTRVSRGATGQWLRKNVDRVLSYLDTYVPLEPSLSGIQATPLYQSRLKDVAP